MSEFTAIRRSQALLFAARMVVLYLLWIRGIKVILPPFIPFVSGLDYLREVPLVTDLLTLVYWICLTGILIGWKFQKFSLALSLLIFYQVLASKLQYSTSYLFAGCLLFLIGLYKPGFQWVFRLQIGLLYLGAGINKALQSDWHSGLYFQNFVSNIFPNRLNEALVQAIGLDYLSIGLSYLTLAIELGLGAWAIFGRKPVFLVYFILVFHLAMLIFTLGELSYTYFFLMAAAAYLILPWREHVPTANQQILAFGVQKNAAFSIFFKKRSGLLKKIAQFQSQESFRPSMGTPIIFHRFWYFLGVFAIGLLAMYHHKIV
ncbi:hypothetical protein [Algoriphagus namhaensis]